MPLYTYKCSKCDEVFESISSISSRDIVKACPACGHFSGERQLDTTNATFQLKGDGFEKRTS